MNLWRHSILLFLLSALACSHFHINPFLEGLPLKGFEQAGPVVVYNKRNLFDYMNGEAEVYLPSGFKLLYTQIFQTKEAGARMIVDVFDMGTPDGARTVFKKSVQEGGSQIHDLGDAAWTDNWAVLFCRGRYYLKVYRDPSPENEIKPTLQDMLDLSRALDGVLKQRKGGSLYPNTPSLQYAFIPLVTFKSVCMGPPHSERTGVFSCVPRLPGWSFQRLIYGGVLPPPAVPLDFARGQGFPP